MVIPSRIQIEKNTIDKMIRLYCRKKHHSEQLCMECREVYSYSKQRLNICQFGNNKPTCKKCLVHCYNPVMRDKIREIMRFSGPLMIWHHPVYAILHVYRGVMGCWGKEVMG